MAGSSSMANTRGRRSAIFRTPWRSSHQYTAGVRLTSKFRQLSSNETVRSSDLLGVTVAPDERHKHAGVPDFGREPVAVAAFDNELLVGGAANGNHQASPVGELSPERRRDRRRARGHQDAVIRLGLGKAERAIA